MRTPGRLWWWEERGVILPGAGDVVAEQIAHEFEDAAGEYR